MDRLPPGFLVRLMECRAYGRTYAHLEAVGGDHAKVPDSPIARLVKRHEMELAAEELGMTLPDE